MKWLKKALLRTLAVCAVLLVLVLVFGPMVLGPIVRSQVVAALNEKLNGSAELADFSFGWGGGVHVGGLAIRDAKGEIVFSTRNVDVDVSVMSAIRGTFIVDIRIADPVVVVRHEADGTLNFQKLVKPDKEPPPPRDPHPKLPTLKAKVTVTGGRVTFFHEDGRSTQATLEARCTVDSLDQPIAFEATIGGIGTIIASGEVTVGKDGRLDLDRLHGPVRLAMSDVPFAKLLPVVSAYAPVSRLDGTLEGSADYELTSMTSAKGNARLDLRGLDVEGAALPQPVRLAAVTLSQKVEIDGEGSGTASVRLEIGDFLAAGVDATTSGIATDMGTADVAITVDAKLKGLCDALGALLRMRQDYTVDGTASLRTTLKAAFGRKALGAVQVGVDAGLAGLSARDGKGRPLPIDPAATMALKASFDPGAPLAWSGMAMTGTAKVETCELRAGTVVVTGRGGADLRNLSLGDSALKIDADLDDVARKIGFLNLGFSFGGRIHVDAKVEGTSDVAKAVSTVQVSALRLTGFKGKDLGPIDLTLDEAGTVDLRPGGRSTLESFKLVSGLVDAEAKAEATDAKDASKTAGSASFTVKAYPAAIQEKLGDFLAGYRLSGSDLLVSGNATFRGKDVTLKGDFRTRDLVVHGPTLGPPGATLKDLSVLYDLACDGGTLDAEIRDLTVECGVFDVALKEASAGARGLVAKLSGSRKGDDVVAKADVKVRDVTARTPQLGPKGAVAAGLSLGCDATANLRTLDADAKRLVLGIATIDAWMKDAARPVGVRGLSVAGSGSRKDDVVDLARLELNSSLARGDGSARITNLMKEGMVADGRFDFGGDVAPLVDLAKAVVPGLKDATSSGTWKFVATVKTEGSRIEVAPTLTIRQMSLDGYRVGDTPLKVEKADIAFESRALVDAQGAGKATIEACSLTAPGARVDVTGSALGFLADPMALTASVHVDATVQPDEIYRRLSALLFGNKIAGQEVKAVADVTVDGRAYAAKGRIAAPALVVTIPPKPPVDPKAPKPGPVAIAQRDMVAEFDLLADLGKERIEIRRCVYESESARGAVEGTIDGWGEAAAVTIRADADLAQLQRDLGSMMPKECELKGRGSAKFDIGGKGRITIIGGATIEGFSLTAPGTKPGEKTTVSEPKIALVCEAVVTRTAPARHGTPGRTDIELGKATVGSGFVNGSASGLVLDATGDMEFKAMKGDFVYVPDRLGAVLRPWLFGGTLTGAEEQKVSFTLDGKARDFDPIRMLRSSQGGASIGIGQFTTSGLAAKGTVDAKIRDEHATTASDLGVNGGAAKMKMDVDLREPSGTVEPVSTMSFGLKDVGANAEVSPILQLIHPIFGRVDQVNGLIEGRIDAAIDLEYRAPVTTKLLKDLNRPEAEGGGWKNLRKEPINGKGRFAMTGLTLKGSPFLTELLGALEIGNLEGLNLDPIEFTIQDGRVCYTNPVSLRIGGQTTRWTGSIGLDQTLDLVWEIPVSDQLVTKYSFMKYWAGQAVRVNVKGTCAHPELQWKALIEDLTRQAARKVIEEKGAEALEGLLNKDEKKARGLLEEADKLYDQGKKADAAQIYKRIRSDYGKTKVFEKNKDRIQQRENEK